MYPVLGATQLGHPVCRWTVLQTIVYAPTRMQPNTRDEMLLLQFNLCTIRNRKNLSRGTTVSDPDLPASQPRTRGVQMHPNITRKKQKQSPYQALPWSGK